MDPRKSFESRDIREHLAAIQDSPQFVRSARLRRFLEFVVERELAGQRDDIQEYVIGLEVFDRGAAFDPRSDSIVRVEARRLRQRLADYYATDGARAPIRIALPERGYVPSFERNDVRHGRRTARVVAASALAAAIAAVWIGLSGRPWTASPGEPTPAAREAFEKGLTAYRQWTSDGARQAQELFQQAIATDPGYARAYAWLSAAYRQESIMGDTDFSAVYPKSAEAARRAVALDPQLDEAHQMLGAVLTFEPDWAAAEHAFRTAVRLGPRNAAVRHAFGIVLLATSARGLAEAESELRHAVRLEPGRLVHRVVLGKILYFRGRLEEAQVLLEEVLRIAPHYSDAMRNLAAVLAQRGEYADAVRLLERAQQLDYLSWGDGLLGYVHAVSGNRAEARAILADLEARFATEPINALAIATIYVGLGEPDPACEWLARAWERREMRTRYVGVDPIYAPVRARACVREILDEMELSEPPAPSH